MAAPHADLSAILIRATLCNMMEWGVFDRLSIEERRAMRLVCCDLKQAVDALTDTLVLVIDNKSLVSFSATPVKDQVQAAFHRCCPSATQLIVKLAYWSFTEDFEVTASVFIDAYAAQVATASSSGVRAVKHCHLHVTADCEVHRAPFHALLRFLAPSLECLTMKSDDPIPNQEETTPALALSALSGCPRLHTLALDEGLVPEAPKGSEDGSRVAQLIASYPGITQLRTLSLDLELTYSDLAALACLTQLECLGVKGFAPDVLHKGPRVLLPNIHTLRGSWETGASLLAQAGSGSGSSWQARWEVDSILLDTLASFPRLQRLEGIAIDGQAGLGALDKLPELPALLQRFASSAMRWALDVDLAYWWSSMDGSTLQETISEHLKPGSLAGLCNLMVSSGRMGKAAPCLASLLAAAPDVEALHLHGRIMEEEVDRLETILQPLNGADRLRKLWFGVMDDCDPDRVIASAILYLTQPDGISGNKARCPHLNYVSIASICSRVRVAGLRLCGEPVERHL